jgi:hypothetical protein
LHTFIFFFHQDTDNETLFVSLADNFVDDGSINRQSGAETCVQLHLWGKLTFL